MSAARIEHFLDEFASADGVREHLGELLHALYGAAGRNGQAARRAWRVVSAAMDAPLRALQAGEERFEPHLDKFLVVLSVASDWRNRHGRTEANAALH
jgi:hypothetical protein